MLIWITYGNTFENKVNYVAQTGHKNKPVKRQLLYLNCPLAEVNSSDNLGQQCGKSDRLNSQLIAACQI
jgi:hypothetical protein